MSSRSLTLDSPFSLFPCSGCVALILPGSQTGLTALVHTTGEKADTGRFFHVLTHIDLLSRRIEHAPIAEVTRKMLKWFMSPYLTLLSPLVNCMGKKARQTRGGEAAPRVKSTVCFTTPHP